MATLYRCDVCFDLIDPVDGDERVELDMRLAADSENTVEQKTVDLCQSCSPSSLDSHVDWLLHRMEGEQ